MTTTNQYLELLAPKGQARQFMKGAPGGGAWVDEFCDGLLHRLSLQNELERRPKVQINTWLLDAPKWQVNVRAQREEGWHASPSQDLLADLVSSLRK